MKYDTDVASAVLMATIGMLLAGRVEAQSVTYGAMPQNCAGVVSYNSSAYTFGCVPIPGGGSGSLTASAFSILAEWDSNTVVQNSTIILALGMPWLSASVSLARAVVNGTSASLTASVVVVGSGTLCAPTAVTGGTSFACSGSVSASSTTELIITGVENSPTLSAVQIFGTHSLP